MFIQDFCRCSALMADPVVLVTSRISRDAFKVIKTPSVDEKSTR